MRCERCGRETVGTIVSFFNPDEVCVECKDTEEKHPEYRAAYAEWQTRMNRGEFDYPGVGLPADLAALAAEKRRELAETQEEAPLGVRPPTEV